MKEAWDIAIIGRLVELVPYKAIFVQKYHTWMKDPYIQEMTCTEPFETIEEEEAYRQTWYTDPQKATFMILRRDSQLEEHNLSSGLSIELREEAIDNEIERLVGDVNLFMKSLDGEQTCEINIMIAEEIHRGKGYAKESVLLAIMYAYTDHHITKFFVKISAANRASIGLFKRLVEIACNLTKMSFVVDSIGFVEINFSEAFQEYEYLLEINTATNLESLTKHAVKRKYHHS